MSKKITNILCAVCFSAFLLGFGAACVFGAPVEILVSERRKAAQFPELSAQSVADKSFFDGLEKYFADKFPERDGFRAIKAAVELGVFGKKDSSGVYFADGHISELDKKLSESSVEKAAEKLNSVYSRYLENADCRVYYSVIPDKNYYLAAENGYPSADYERLVSVFTSNVKNMEYIDIFDCLNADSYYKTDTHWRQEALGEVVDTLAEKMNFKADGISGYSARELSDFKGIYASRFPLASMSDRLVCLSSPVTDCAAVYNLETDKKSIGVYDEEKLKGYDKYDVFLSGASALITVENPLASNGRELVIFRDSFGSSLAPLLLGGYQKITLVDLRYISSQLVGDYVDFNGADVLFIYNTQILNQSAVLK